MLISGLNEYFSLNELRHILSGAMYMYPDLADTAYYEEH